MFNLKILSYSVHQDLVDKINTFEPKNDKGFPFFKAYGAMGIVMPVAGWLFGAPLSVMLLVAVTCFGFGWFSVNIEKHHIRQYTTTIEKKLKELHEVMRHHDYSLDPLFSDIFRTIEGLKNHEQVAHANQWLDHIYLVLHTHHQNQMQHNEIRRAMRTQILPQNWAEVDEEWGDLVSAHGKKSRDVTI